MDGWPTRFGALSALFEAGYANKDLALRSMNGRLRANARCGDL